MTGWWQVLGVPRDSDRAAVRRAYATKLRITNPEDDPQGFMALRQAYEEALQWMAYDSYAIGDDGDIALASGARFDSGATPIPVETSPSPAGQPAAPDPDPAAELRARDQADLRRHTSALEAGLRGPWFKDAAGLSAALDAILAAPAMIEIDTRDAVEHWLAWLLADTVPRSDAILRQAIAAFGWEAEGNRPDAVWRILERIDEWRMIEGLAEGRHGLSAGWRALTRSGSAPWRRRISALRPGIEQQVRRLLDLVDYQTRGLVHSLDPGALAWWRAHLERARFGFIDLVMLLIGGGAAWVFAAAGTTPEWRWGGAGAAVAGGIAFPLLRLGLVMPWRARRAARDIDEGWPEFGWIIPWLLAAMFLLVWPVGGNATGWAVVALSAIALVWMAVAVGREPELGNPLFGMISLGALGFLGGAAFLDLPFAVQCALGAFALAALGIAKAEHGALARLLWRATHRPAVLALVLALLLAASAFVRGQLPHPPTPIVPWLGATVTGMTLLAAVRNVHDDGIALRILPWVRWGLWIALVVAAILSTPKAERLAPPIAVDPMTQIESREPGFAALRTGNPELHAAVAAIYREVADGRRNRDEAGRAVDRLVNIAYRTRLPDAPAALIADEFEIRLLLLREYQTRDPRACADGGRKNDRGRVTDGLQRRHFRHALAVAASAPASAAERAAGQSLSAPALLQQAADGDPAQMARYDAAMRGTDVRAKCAARIAILEVITALSDVDLAKMMRPTLAAQAAEISRQE